MKYYQVQAEIAWKYLARYEKCTGTKKDSIIGPLASGGSNKKKGAWLVGWRGVSRHITLVSILAH